MAVSVEASYTRKSALFGCCVLPDDAKHGSTAMAHATSIAIPKFPFWDNGFLNALRRYNQIQQLAIRIS